MNKISKFQSPPFLKKGNTIMIVSPAGFLKEASVIQSGIQLAESWGLHVVLGQHYDKKFNHFAGTDEERLEDLQNALDDPNIHAIWCARGGYGTVRIIDQLDFSKFIQHPKWIIGFSDITTLHCQLHKIGFQSLHATMPGGIASATTLAKETLYNALFHKPYQINIPSNSLNKTGSTEGILVGGNLSIIDSMLSSASQIDWKDKIMFIEEVGEHLYRVDRMIYSLKRSGALEHLKGIIVGDFEYEVESNLQFGGSHREIILNAAKAYSYPVIFDFPAGHINNNAALIFGKKIRLISNLETTQINF
ncbi:S66 peptidase family protein [Flavobacterium sp. TSSA_36]|uniref:S66 peptidase family protein n=1 Tax=Flavobacterium sp. TSSA_36 TaxID=3447669 RepID=UPI003F3C826F